MWKKFLRLDVWKKFEVLASLAAIIGLPLTFYLSGSDSSKDRNTQSVIGDNNTDIQIRNGGEGHNTVILNQIDIDKQSRIDALQNLIDVFGQIKALLPPNQVISDCTKGRRNEKFLDAYEACNSISKINNTNALNLVERIIDKIKLLLPNDKYDLFVEDFEKLRFLIYEIQNNALSREHWRSNNCPNSIVFSKDLPRFHKHNKDLMKCVLVLEGYDSFFDRKSKSEHPPYKATAKELVPMSRMSQYQYTFIIPSKTASDENIDSYFEKLNTELYTSINEQMNIIVIKFKELM